MKVSGAHPHLALFGKELLPFAASVSVSTLTTLLPFTDVGTGHRDVLIVLENSDPTNTCTLFVDVSHNGTYANSARRQTKIAQPQDECSIELNDPMLYTYIRLSAVAGAGTVPVKFGIVARER